MHFVLQIPLLQHIAGLKIVTHLWTQRNIMTQIEQLPTYPLPSFEDRRNQVWKKWMVIEENVKSNVGALPLPRLCKQPLLSCIRPLGMEIITWCRYHSGRNNCQILIVFLGNHLRWTMHGTVDYAKTAELMVKDERLDVETRYRIACINCLEDAARELIKFIPEKRRQEYINDKACYCSREFHLLITYFTCTLSGDVDQLNRLFRYWDLAPGDGSINQYLFLFVLCEGCRATCEYFSRQLTPEEKEQVLTEFELYEVCIARSSTCLSLMNEEQQRHMIRRSSYDLLTCLLRWPMQSLFMDAAVCRWNLLDEDDCARLLYDITVSISLGYKDYDYSQLFWECWRLTSADDKRYFLDDNFYLQPLLESKEEGFVKLVVNEAPSLHLITLFFQYDEIRRVLMDESVISNAALMECKQTALLNSSNDEEDVEKRLRSQHVSRVVDFVMERRMGRKKSMSEQFKENVVFFLAGILKTSILRFYINKFYIE